MRIRKHAKISPLVYAASSLKPGTVLQTHVCQLNQSPWDVMTFSPSSDPTTPPPPPPPPPAYHEVDKDDSYMDNGTFAEYIGADKSTASLKFGLDDEKEKWDDIGVPAAESFDNGRAEAEKEDHLSFKKKGEVMLCCKSDGKGWQCRRKAKEGHSLCEHHTSQLKSYSNYLGNPIVKKSDDKASETRRRARPKKPTSSSNPYEFYYYSGFGPRWGKKRGPTVTTAEPYSSAVSRGTSKNNFLDVYEPNTPKPNATIAASASASASPSSQIDNEGFDYVEDEEDDEDDGESGKKRARKPIKARSLKSLM